jgi:hypothetical protein
MSYEAFIQDCIKYCRCCPECGGFGIPCDGTMAGGFCDTMCICPDHDDRDEESDSE